MFIYRGENLKEYLIKADDGKFKKRFLFKELENYAFGSSDSKVCCLYGLRRTGKTVMMHQLIRDINDYNNCLLIHCECDEKEKTYDTMQMVRNAISSNSDCQYIFIDEITKTKNFIGTASFLADDYAKRGKKVIIAGADSFGFFLTKGNELLDRMKMIHTTYIPYKEYKELLNKTVVDYIKYGGTLTDGSVFYNKDDFKEYMNSSIAENISHSLARWNQGRNYGVLEEIVSVSHDELPSFINKVVEYHNRTFLARVINDDFKSHDLGSLIDLMTKHNIADTTPLESEELNDRIRIYLGIKENPFSHVDEECVDTIINYLKDLDVLYEIPRGHYSKQKEYLFTQVGVRYWQCEALCNALMDSEEFSVNYNDVEKHSILQKIKEDICGGILEDIVFYQLSVMYKDNSDIQVIKYRNSANQEIDVLLENLKTRESIAFEIKFSDESFVEGQAKHLMNEEFLKDVKNNTGTDIIWKIVLYEGKSEYAEKNNIFYLNTDYFLCRSESIIKYMFEKNISLLMNEIENSKKLTIKQSNGNGEGGDDGNQDGTGSFGTTDKDSKGDDDDSSPTPPSESPPQDNSNQSGGESNKSESSITNNTNDSVQMETNKQSPTEDFIERDDDGRDDI